MKTMIAVIVSFGFLHIANGGTATGTLPVATLVSANCSVSSALLPFGNYAPIGANAQSPLNGTTSFQIACTKGANVVISMNNGLNSANAQGTTRAMSDGHSHYLSYDLYSNSGYSNVWSNSNPVSYMPTSSAAYTEMVYGKIPGGQNAMVGNYTDIVIITATF